MHGRAPESDDEEDETEYMGKLPGVGYMSWLSGYMWPVKGRIHQHDPHGMDDAASDTISCEHSAPSSRDSGVSCSTNWSGDVLPGAPPLSSPQQLERPAKSSKGLKLLLLVAKTAAVAAAGYTGSLLLYGDARRTAAAVVLAAGAASVRNMRGRHNRSLTAASSGDSGIPSAATLGLPGAAWLNEDVRVRLMDQAAGDRDKARDKALTINSWREAQGMNQLQYASTAAAPVQPAGRRAAWLTVTHTRAHPPAAAVHPTNQHGAPSLAGPGQTPAVRTAAVAAAARFGPVSHMMGLTLIHINEEQGNACLWVRGICLGAARKAMCALLASEGPHQAADPSTAWLHAITMHVAVLSDWLWTVRLPGQPLEGGRFYQVVDLKGVTMGSAGELVAVLRAIMAAAHNFPQRLRATVVIHPPPGVALAWSIVKKLLPPAITAKIRILRGTGKVLLAELSTFLPPALIPEEAGGSCSTPLSQRPVQLEAERAIIRAAGTATH